MRLFACKRRLHCAIYGSLMPSPTLISCVWDVSWPDCCLSVPLFSCCPQTPLSSDPAAVHPHPHPPILIVEHWHRVTKTIRLYRLYRFATWWRIKDNWCQDNCYRPFHSYRQCAPSRSIDTANIYTSNVLIVSSVFEWKHRFSWHLLFEASLKWDFGDFARFLEHFKLKLKEIPNFPKKAKNVCPCIKKDEWTLKKFASWV